MDAEGPKAAIIPEYRKLRVHFRTRFTWRTTAEVPSNNLTPLDACLVYTISFPFLTDTEVNKDTRVGSEPYLKKKIQIIGQ